MPEVLGIYDPPILRSEEDCLDCRGSYVETQAVIHHHTRSYVACAHIVV